MRPYGVLQRLLIRSQIFLDVDLPVIEVDVEIFLGLFIACQSVFNLVVWRLQGEEIKPFQRQTQVRKSFQRVTQNPTGKYPTANNFKRFSESQTLTSRSSASTTAMAMPSS